MKLGTAVSEADEVTKYVGVISALVRVEVDAQKNPELMEKAFQLGKQITLR